MPSTSSESSIRIRIRTIIAIIMLTIIALILTIGTVSITSRSKVLFGFKNDVQTTNQF